MKNTTPTQSYDGEQIYVGIDMHKKTYVVVDRVKQVIVKHWSTAAKPADLAAQLLKYFKGGSIHTVYEAGFSGFVLHRELSHQGINSIVVHPAAVEVAVHNRVKTDNRDAEKLSAQLEAGRLGGIRVPTPAQEQQRMLSRTRTQLVQERAAVKHQIRMKAHQHRTDPDGTFEWRANAARAHQSARQSISARHSIGNRLAGNSQRPRFAAVF
jgi:transposase